jgi:hypothetical protein
MTLRFMGGYITRGAKGARAVSVMLLESAAARPLRNP